MRRFLLLATARGARGTGRDRAGGSEGSLDRLADRSGPRPCSTGQGRRRVRARHAARVARPARRVLPPGVPAVPGLDHSDATYRQPRAALSRRVSRPRAERERHKLVQDVYPYARTPVTYMSPGQRFWSVNHTHGGWFVAGPGLKAALVAAGLPESPPPAASGRSFPWAWLAAGVLAVVVLLALVLRRRRSARFRMVRSTA